MDRPVLPSLAAVNKGIPRLADNAPTYEVLLGAKPDFTTASFGRHYKKAGGVASRDRLEQTGIASHLSPTDCEGATSINGGGARTKPLTLDALYREIHDLAAIFDVPDRGRRLVAKLKARTTAARKGVDLGGRTVLFWFADTRTPYVAGGLGAPLLAREADGMKNVYSAPRKTGRPSGGSRSSTRTRRSSCSGICSGIDSLATGWATRPPS